MLGALFLMEHGENHDRAEHREEPNQLRLVELLRALEDAGTDDAVGDPALESCCEEERDGRAVTVELHSEVEGKAPRPLCKCRRRKKCRTYLESLLPTAAGAAKSQPDLQKLLSRHSVAVGRLPQM